MTLLGKSGIDQFDQDHFCMLKWMAENTKFGKDKLDIKYRQAYNTKVGYPTERRQALFVIYVMEALKMEAVRDYIAHLDSKRRITLRGSAYEYYDVKEYENGCIILEPREMQIPDTISARTLEEMDQAVANFKNGVVSPVIDLSDFEQ